MARALLLALAVPVLLAALAARFWPEARRALRPLVHEPPGLAEALRAEPGRVLTAEEREALQRDGVVLLRGVVSQRAALRSLEEFLWPHAGMPFEASYTNAKPWFFNGAARSLLRDGPLGALAASAYGMEEGPLAPNVGIIAQEAPLWGYPAFPKASPNSWHGDMRLPRGASLDTAQLTMLSTWMPLTDAGRGLEFLRGSHARRGEAEARCGRVVVGGKNNHTDMDAGCLEGLAQELSAELGYPSQWGPELAAGDVFLFHGHTLHRGIRQPWPRLAISIRFSASISTFNPAGPTVFPKMPEAFDGIGWQLFPGKPHSSPWVPAFTGGLIGRLLGR